MQVFTIKLDLINYYIRHDKQKFNAHGIRQSVRDTS